MMNIWVAMLLITLAGLGGLIVGTFLLRKESEKQFNAHLNNYVLLDSDGLRSLMSQMGQKPNEAKVQQTFRQLKQAQKEAQAKAKAKKK